MGGRLASASALNRLDLPGRLHPLTLVVGGAQGGEGINLDDLLAQVLGGINHLLLLCGGLALRLAAGREVAVGLDREGHGAGNLVHAVVLVLGHEHVLRQERAHLRGLGDELRHLALQLVAALAVLAAAGEGEGLHDRAHEGHGEVAAEAHDRLLDLVAVVSHGEVEHLVQARDMLVLLVVPEAGIAHVEVAEDVSVAAGDELGRLDAAAHRQTNVGAEGEVGGQAAHLGLIVAADIVALGDKLDGDATGD